MSEVLLHRGQEGDGGGEVVLDVLECTSSGTYTVPSGLLRLFILVACGAQGGPSGRKAATSLSRAGGAGAAGSSWVLVEVIDKSLLTSTLGYTLGAGSPGGLAQTTDTTNGLASSAGGTSSVGTGVNGVSMAGSSTASVGAGLYSATAGQRAQGGNASLSATIGSNLRLMRFQEGGKGADSGGSFASGGAPSTTTDQAGVAAINGFPGGGAGEGQTTANAVVQSGVQILPGSLYNLDGVRVLVSNVSATTTKSVLTIPGFGDVELSTPFTRGARGGTFNGGAGEDAACNCAGGGGGGCGTNGVSDSGKGGRGGDGYIVFIAQRIAA